MQPAADLEHHHNQYQGQKRQAWEAKGAFAADRDYATGRTINNPLIQAPLNEAL
jgi:hypothetical protein